MKPFQCGHCGSTVFFENTLCQSCGSALGFRLADNRFVAWLPGADTQAPQACANRDLAGCNWLPEDGQTDGLCPSCRLNEVIPDLSQAGDAERWAAVERAKRRLLYTLHDLGLMPAARRGPDDALGLALRIPSPHSGEPVMTGHLAGVISIDLREADDLHREHQRVSFNEPWRTLLGHLRHEIGHFLHHRWIANHPLRLQRWREVFGDETADYATALKRHHEQGPPPDWSQFHISAYASMHPHEDWAETCAHLLLVLDAVQTAQAWGLQLHSPAATVQLEGSTPVPAQVDELVIGQWLPVAQFLNAMNRSLGLADSYPFLLSDRVVLKLRTAMQLLHAAREEA